MLASLKVYKTEKLATRGKTLDYYRRTAPGRV